MDQTEPPNQGILRNYCSDGLTGRHSTNARSQTLLIPIPVMIPVPDEIGILLNGVHHVSIQFFKQSLV